MLNTNKNDKNKQQKNQTNKTEKLRDLLNPSRKSGLKIKLQSNGETWVSNLTETHVSSLLDVLHLISVASDYRTRAETSMNATSSRSHMLMSLTLAVRCHDGTARVSKLHVCCMYIFVKKTKYITQHKAIMCTL